jgi:hypothetical protein
MSGLPASMIKGGDVFYDGLIPCAGSIGNYQHQVKKDTTQKSPGNKRGNICPFTELNGTLPT